MKEINEFQGDYRWLSNFWHAPIVIGGMEWASNEHAYQAAKSLNPADWKTIQNCRSASYAKVYGSKITIREDWEDIKLAVMAELTAVKYDQNPDLKAKLMATKGMMLVEGNHWGDTFWGVCRGMGLNHLGRIIMDYRDR
ncbi:NADAR family protein [Mesorhizobium sp. M7A.F.Ca.CA.002.12.1.1]|uniref:NADAR family protein n=1 Tax=Mesorhizobium sp. M7A.F.Ca.CA.002.12.1.1 TaxID=2496735 RepID=UPI000FCBEF8C|nr:NADAR family protein [Mesorhizobium sp. M7A.F.Ca.CA.002.12.1.1]RUX60140.1 NADAR family protein [Mesorhizobium sp. M7A.F.Ca.CA.002.12.1.1]